MKFRAVLSVLLFGLAGPSWSAVIFSDDFQDGNVDGWVHSTNHPGVAGIESSLWGGGVTGVEELGGGDRSLRTFLIPPPSGTALWSRATTSINVAADGDYELSLQARSRNCEGCVMFYEIFLDGVALWDHLSPGATAVTSFEDRTFALTGLAAGSHELTLGVYTTAASAGFFQAFFDDVCVTDTPGEDCFAPVVVPAPATLGLLALTLLGLGLRGQQQERHASA